MAQALMSPQVMQSIQEGQGNIGQAVDTQLLMLEVNKAKGVLQRQIMSKKREEGESRSKGEWVNARGGQVGSSGRNRQANDGCLCGNT